MVNFPFSVQGELAYKLRHGACKLFLKEIEVIDYLFTMSYQYDYNFFHNYENKNDSLAFGSYSLHAASDQSNLDTFKVPMSVKGRSAVKTCLHKALHH